MYNFPTAQQSLDSAKARNDIAFQDALGTVKRAIGGAIEAGKFATTLNVVGWNQALLVEIKRFLISKGYKVEMYYGCQRDPACDLNIAFGE